MNIKIKNIFLLTLLVVGLFLTMGVQKVSAADDCGTKFKPGYVCIDTTVFPSVTGCVANHCSSQPNKVKCCPPTNNETTPTGNTPAVTTPSSPTAFTNPLEFKTVEEFLGTIMSAIQKIIVVLALVFIMIGAVMILASAGNSGMVEKGKGAITMALVGLALGIAAPSLLKELANIIGWGSKCTAIADAGMKAACLAKEKAVGGALTLSQIAMNVLNFLLGTMGIVALVMMIIGSTLYLTSAGDEDRAEKGKEIFKYALIGVLLAMSAMIIVKQIAQFFV